ncbi:UDP-N-acetylmuramate--L-alanine ligase [Aquipuribacter hungaricus]|uniref:UDP-N-acetylmuramate--L-alanine ligase n=1 Tax=Aquipuribacter hungaricus TaxID=545624 RepID=A0ABV7WMH3_9MICO
MTDPQPSTPPAGPAAAGPAIPAQPTAEELRALLRTGPVHVVAAGGAGMSAVVRLLLDDGVPVTGSDSRASGTLEALAERGATVHVGHDAAHVAGARLVVVSTAVRPDNTEVAAARAAGVPVVHRSVALAGLMADDRVVAVAGTHGKTTTTSMTAVAARAAGLDPSYAIGGDLVVDRVNARRGTDRVFVAEADESDGSFLAYAPDVAVVTNVEADHLDHYGDVEAVHAAFARFAGRVRPGGLLVVGADDRGARALVRGLPAGGTAPQVVTVGEAADADVRVVLLDPATLPEAGDDVLAAARVVLPAVPAAAGGTGSTGAGEHLLLLRVPGRHNVADAALALTAAVLGLRLDPARVAAGLGSFTGARRRFETVGEAAGVRVVDDYAHHPTEVAATLAAARTVAGRGRVHVLFQPHLYSRTRIFAEGFGTALQEAGSVVVLDVYGAREDPEPGVDGALVADLVPGARFVPDREEALAVLAAAARPGDLVLTVGAGDVTELGPRLLERLRAQEGPA